MKSELKLIMDSAGELNLEEYCSLDDYFCVNVLMGIGLPSSNEMDYFEVRVCSLKWLELNEVYPLLLRHTLIINKYNYESLLKAIEECLGKCSGSSWEDISMKLSRFFLWEFEDYVEV